MGVLIKGLQMPKECNECFFRERGYPDWCYLLRANNAREWRGIEYGKRRADCPLEEVGEDYERTD